MANSHENYNNLELGDVWNLGHPLSSQENIWRSEERFKFLVGFWELRLAHLLRSSGVSKLSNRRLAPPSAQQCHSEEFQSLSKRGKRNGWFKIMRAWRELTPFVDWRNLTFQEFILCCSGSESHSPAGHIGLTTSHVRQSWAILRPCTYSECWAGVRF